MPYFLSSWICFLTNDNLLRMIQVQSLWNQMFNILTWKQFMIYCIISADFLGLEWIFYFSHRCIIFFQTNFFFDFFLFIRERICVINMPMMISNVRWRWMPSLHIPISITTISKIIYSLLLRGRGLLTRQPGHGGHHFIFLLDAL